MTAPDRHPADACRPNQESGAEGVEPRSGRTRNPTPRGARRRSDATGSGANRVLLRPGGTAAARKITDNGPGSVVSSSAAVEASDGGQLAEAVRVERLRAWARGVVASFPPWSEQQWREVNAALGYRLKERE